MVPLDFEVRVDGDGPPAHYVLTSYVRVRPLPGDRFVQSQPGHRHHAAAVVRVEGIVDRARVYDDEVISPQTLEVDAVKGILRDQISVLFYVQRL
jgi:hypothetical protein